MECSPNNRKNKEIQTELRISKNTQLKCFCLMLGKMKESPFNFGLGSFLLMLILLNIQTRLVFITNLVINVTVVTLLKLDDNIFAGVLVEVYGDVNILLQ
jgi:hypothetical protein